MTKRVFVGVAFAVLAASLSQAESGEAAPAPLTPTLRWLRAVIVKRGVPPKFVRIEQSEEGDASARVPRLVFWVRTRRITQTVVIAIVGEAGARYVRIHSARLARAPADHPRLVEVMAYLLDRNFVMSGAQFARDASGGEIALRAELAVGEGLSESEFNRALETLLRTADEEAPRLAGVLGDGAAESPE